MRLKTISFIESAAMRLVLEVKEKCYHQPDANNVDNTIEPGIFIGITPDGIKVIKRQYGKRSPEKIIDGVTACKKLNKDGQYNAICNNQQHCWRGIVMTFSTFINSFGQHRFT